ncbi:sensor histidine kinase [Hymenobacter psychrotolerans]|uniref:histidine kinase n=1 Tax=Hymenobacter psychrotolerans DSM 18569 TaxID=1121959 RepID=A0A1M7AUG7_9BACT|nr:sensor histidine kinase [Hymenobacter psychrotolerans]SHL46276.1 Histidine kinase-, DNA gyrase B-, and HSP90-like ATPase [Hymenobacter psychrotolerans DSM 18569]
MNSWLVPVLLATPVLLLLALGIVAFVLRYQRRLLRQQEQLRQVRETAQQQALEAALLAQEEERRRIAADLHDGVGTTLAIVKLHLSTLGQPDLTQEATSLLDQAITEVRRISRNLLPAALQKFGLPFALDALARTVPADGPTRLTLEQRGQPRRLDPKYELIVYRVVQELLGNGLRHAHAEIISVVVDFGTDILSLHYSDNGVGFDPALVEVAPLPGARTGHGLTNLRSRVAVLQGTLRYESGPGAGSQVWISFPIPYLTAIQAPDLSVSL